jgi:choline dehydrogenase
MPTEKGYDYVIVGGGTSGCVLANRLSANSDIRVLLLEAGGPDTDSRIHTVDGFTSLFGSALDWNFVTEAQPELAGRRMVINQGRVLGGGSSIHAMMFVRGNRMNYDLWSATGCDGWSYDEVLPYFEKSEDYEGGASEYHGVGGELSVRLCPDPNSVGMAFRNAAVELGYRGPDWDVNGVCQEDGAGANQFNITRDGRRSSAAVAFLTPVLSRPNLTVKTGAEATRLLLEGNRAMGVELLQGGRAQQIRCGREVIVCAGSFLSPKLLMISGIGPAEHLRAHGVETAVDLPGVGQNLQDHLQLPVLFKKKAPQPAPTLLAGNVMFTRTRPAGMRAGAPDLQLLHSPEVPGPVAASFPVSGPACLYAVCLVQPFSRGSVTLRSARPEDPPVINPNYLRCEADARVLIRGVELVRALADTRAFSESYATELVPGPDADLGRFVRERSLTIWHPVGTCRMGRDQTAVTDPQLRVRGVDGLRVADASVMPTIPSGNTNAACVMIAEKATAMILDR